MSAAMQETPEPIVLGNYRNRTPDRYVSGFGGASVAIYQPAGVPKPKEECQPFTFSICADPKFHDRYAASRTKVAASIGKELNRKKKPKVDNVKRFLRLKFPVRA